MHEDQITVTYSVDEDEFMKACHAVWAQQAIGHKGNVVVGAIMGGCALGMVWLKVPWYFSAIVMGCAVFTLFASTIRNILWRRHYRGLDKYNAPITTILAADGFAVVLNGERSVAPWSTFAGYLTTEDALILTAINRQVSVIPFESFNTSAEAGAFAKRVAEHVPLIRKRRF